MVPSRRRKSGSAYVKCFRLVTEDVRQVEEEAVLPSETDGEKDEGKVVSRGFLPQCLHSIAGQEGIKVNVTVHRQIVDLLAYAGAEGLTLQVRVVLKRKVPVLLDNLDRTYPQHWAPLTKGQLSYFYHGQRNIPRLPISKTWESSV